MSAAHEIRGLRRRDRAAVREICAQTAWMGRPDTDRIGDDWIWAEFWTRYFTDRDRTCSWVAVTPGDARVVGYLTGTPDVRRVDRYVPYLLPGVVLRVVRKRLMRHARSCRAIVGLLRSMLRDELSLPPRLADRYPATCHINLLPAARRRGLGRVLMRTFLEQMRSLGAPGVHAQMLSVNEPIRRFCSSFGFRHVATSPLTAFAHVDGHPIELLTWVLAL